MTMWTDPDGIRHDAIPQRWRSNGRVVELAGSAAMARRLGWSEDAPPGTAAILATRAAEVLSRPGAVEAVQEVLARVGEVAAAGVAITDWSYQGVTAAIEGAMTGEASRDLALMRHGLALRTAWDRVIYHAGTMKDAQELWPAMVARMRRSGVSISDVALPAFRQAAGLTDEDVRALVDEARV